MRRILALAVCFFAPSVLVRFNESETGIGTTSFISLPKDPEAAASRGWLQVERPPGPEEYSSLVMWCPRDDYTVCVLYDDTGYVAGMQNSIDQEAAYDLIFDMPTVGFIEWSTVVNENPKKYWTINQFYISKEKLTTDPATRKATRDPSKFLQDTDIFVQGFGKLNKISVNPSDFDSKVYEKHNCLDGMGTHYYYKLTDDFECKDENMFPWFIVVQNDQLVSVGLLVSGKRKRGDGQIDWLEDYNEKVVEAVLRKKVQCLWDIGKTKGFIVLHTYFIEKPYDIKC